LRRLAGLVLGLSAAVALGACGSSPQIVQITPSRGARGVRTDQTVSIVFDRAMNEASVNQRFRLQPAARGSISWPDDHTLVFSHAVLRTDTDYRAILASGYASRAGAVNGLTHSWPFHTESPPSMTGSSPSSGQSGVDPSAYIDLSFSRPMNLSTLASAISISPQTSFSLVPDASDANSVHLVPATLLQPGRRYDVAVSSAARDRHGNDLPGRQRFHFYTGPVQPLRQWITFTVSPTSASARGGIYVVNQLGLPRPLLSVPSSAFSWSPDGTSLLVHTLTGGWIDAPLGRPALPLPFNASWAGALAPGLGYAYLGAGSLSVLTAGGEVVSVAQGVTTASVSPDGRRIAFAVTAGSETQIRAFDPGLRAQYLIQAEHGNVDGLTWAPDASAIAYRMLAPDGRSSQIKVRYLTGAGASRLVTRGQVSDPLWVDPQHLLVTAPGGAGTGDKVFVLSLATAPVTISAADAMPQGPVDVTSPAPSGDGHQIAFVSASGRAEGRQLYVMNADGTGLRQLTDWDPRAFPYSVAMPAWTSP